jgi:hypothetical protein
MAKARRAERDPSKPATLRRPHEVSADAEAQELRPACGRQNYRRTLFTLRGSVAVNAALWGVNSVRSHSLDELAWNDRNERYVQDTEDQEDEHD